MGKQPKIALIGPGSVDKGLIAPLIEVGFVVVDFAKQKEKDIINIARTFEIPPSELKPRNRAERRHGRKDI